ESWTRTAIRLRWPIVIAWLAVVVVGGWASGRLSDLQSNVFTVPGTDSERVRGVLQRHFGDRSDGAFTVVFELDRPASTATRVRLQRVVDRAARAVPTGRGTALLQASPDVVYGDVIAALNLDDAKGRADDLLRALGRPAGTRVYVTGAPAIQNELDPIFSDDLRKGETIALPIALLVLLLVFGLSFAVTIPLLFAASTVFGTLSRLRRRPLRDDADLRHEPGLPDRDRDRDRLLAADRLSLPRGALAPPAVRRSRRAKARGPRDDAGPRRRGRSAADDGDRRPRGDLLGGDGRGRARAAPLYAAPVHSGDRGRRLPDPARLAPRGGNAPARIARDLRPARHPPRSRRAMAAAAGAAGRGRRRASVLGAARPLDHAAEVALRARGRRFARRGRDPGRVAAADAGGDCGDPAAPPVGAR